MLLLARLSCAQVGGQYVPVLEDPAHEFNPPEKDMQLLGFVTERQADGAPSIPRAAFMKVRSRAAGQCSVEGGRQQRVR